MGTVIGDLLPLAVGVSISPIPLVAAILMILSKNASAAAGGFASGWTAGIVLATVVFAVLAGVIGLSGDSEPGGAAAWMKIGLGLLLLAVAVAQWGHRADTAEPGWMRGIDRITAGKAVLLGATLAAVNPKNLLLCASAGVAVGASGLGVGAQTVAVVVFTVLAAASVLGVVVGYAVAADRLRGTLDRARAWLEANNHVVMAIVLSLMGAVVLGKGIGGL
ncbi:GAP family protein [Nocardia jinanensis]|uniref:Membrane protein n=2 Tax=Nocardia jinanensis TaxID=382504 RepID=A0A917RQZ4_9NOCA|nr:GAP family protein [Nocardia jinanensis]GGL19944.1 membrane protein [Nocardia jinanensis]